MLLVEDETVILEMNAKMLERLGYRVLSTGSAIEALNLVQRHGRIDMLITDIIMPEMNGRELAERILQQRPGLKCLYVSGYSANVIARQGVLPEGVHFIEKPFLRRVLAMKIREILQEKSQAASDSPVYASLDQGLPDHRLYAQYVQ